MISAKHIAEAQEIVSNRENHRPSLVALAIRVMRQHMPEFVKLEVVR